MIIGLLLLVFAGPRVATIFWWLLRPTYFSATFDTILWPLLGILFVPFMTLMYLIVAPGGIVGFDWVWLALALFCDIAAYGGAYTKKDEITPKAK
jgi:hypothetical protein